MPMRLVQIAVVQHEYKQFPWEAPGFLADVNKLQDLWDAVYAQPGVPKDARLVVGMQHPASRTLSAGGGTLWQRWGHVDSLPSTELDAIRVKAVCQQPPGIVAQAPIDDKKGNAGKTTKGNRPASKKKGGRREGGRKAAIAGPAAGWTAKLDEGDKFDLVRRNLNKIDEQVTVKDSNLDRVEAQMLDSYNSNKKVAVLLRIQDRLAATLAMLHEQQTAILVAALAIEDRDGNDVGYGETWAERMMCTADEDSDNEDIDGDDVHNALL